MMAAVLLTIGCGLALTKNTPLAWLLSATLLMIALAAAVAAIVVGRKRKRPGERAGAYSARPQGLRSRPPTTKGR